MSHPRPTGLRLIELERARELLGQVSQLYRARDRHSAETSLLRVLASAGFTSSRLYYLDDRRDLVAARAYGHSQELKEQIRNEGLRLPPAGDRSAGAKASYYATVHNRPIVVRVDPGGPNNLNEHFDSQGIPFIAVRSAPLRSTLKRPVCYQWLDLPLLTHTYQSFGKISLDKAHGREPIRAEDYYLVYLLHRSISGSCLASLPALCR